MMKTIWKNRAAIALVVMGIICFVVAVQAQSFRAFAVVFVLGLLLIARPFKQTVIGNLGKWIKDLKKSRLEILALLLVGGCATAPVQLSDMQMVPAGSKVEYFAESAPNHLSHRTSKRIAHIKRLPKGFTHREIKEWAKKAHMQKAPPWGLRTVVKVNGSQTGVVYPDR